MEETGQSDKEVLAAEEGSRELCLALEERLGRAGEERGPNGEGVYGQLNPCSRFPGWYSVYELARKTY